MVEVGQDSVFSNIDTTLTSTTYAAHLTLVAGGIKSQITRTRYDIAYNSTISGYFGTVGQENLRGRIATVMYSPTNGTSGGVPTFEQATHYSYDIHGNVKILIQDHSTFGQKRLDYNYELISGNVNSVTYQKGRWDQFIHYYSYDLNNRLKWVQTSQFPTAVPAPSSGMREQEAQYFYYRHGPLRRTELGTLKVQGVDYAYTIQGWIKGVNSGQLTHQWNDIGQDGRPGTTNSAVGRDAFGYVLGYFSNSGSGQNDYHPINTAAPVFDRDGYTVGTAAALYNGNIAKMTTATRDNDNTTAPGIRSQRMQYRYDQLQRIKKQDAFDWNGTTYASTTAYAMALTYDAGGNIKTMTRNGDATALSMDNLTYNYNTAKPNRLTQITDAVPTTTFADDLETQAANNYAYDNIGNMTGDVSEGGKTVTWNVYNKITNVSMSSGTKTLAFGYDAGGNRVRKESKASSITTKQWYVRDAQGNIMSTYKQVGTGTLKQEYVYLYGSTRVGEYLLNRDSATIWNRHYYRVKGSRHYELTNHLGNVLAVVTDRKMAKDTTADATYTPQFFMPDVYSVQNYYAFGQSMPNWSSTAAVNDPKKYRFGFNGKEDDDEWAKQDYGARIYDGRVGRFLSVDPLSGKNLSLSSYEYANNSPIGNLDNDGKDNILYIIIIKNSKLKLTTTHTDAIAKRAQDIYDAHGLKVLVVAREVDRAYSQEELKLLDPTDRLTYIGDKDDLIKIDPVGLEGMEEGRTPNAGQVGYFSYNNYFTDYFGGYARSSSFEGDEKKEEELSKEYPKKAEYKGLKTVFDAFTWLARGSIHEAGGHGVLGSGHPDGESIMSDGTKTPRVKYPRETRSSLLTFTPEHLKKLQEYYNASRSTNPYKLVVTDGNKSYEPAGQDEERTPSDNFTKKLSEKNK